MNSKNEKDTNKVCKVEECNNIIKTKGYCSRHYQQIKTHGKILERTRLDRNEIIMHGNYAEVILYNNECKEVARALIDIEDIELVKSYKWYLNSWGYVASSIDGNYVKLHRFIMNPPKNMVVDHINHNRLDNRKQNLRVVSHRENCSNRNSKGYCYDSILDKWIIYYFNIDVNDWVYYYVSTEEEAIQLQLELNNK